MRHSSRILSFALILLIVTAACTGTAVSTAEPNLLVTIIAQTAYAAFTLTAQPSAVVPIGEISTVAVTSTATDTSTPEPPTLTPTATLSPTPIFTWTPLVPLISVSVPTNCRSGPGKVYDYRGALLVGEIAEVVGRDPTGNYWYIRNPANSSQFCWIWGEYATVIGSLSQLPVYTPPPSPTPTITSTPVPSFTASYIGLQTCNGNYWADLKLKNTGTATFRSISVTLKDMKTSRTVTLALDGFRDRTGCNSSTKDVLSPGKTVTASSPVFGYNPQGHNINATVTLCTATGLNGYCKTVKFSFKP